MYNQLPKKRYGHTIEFLQNVLPAPATILDLGVRNPFSEIMEQHLNAGRNNNGEDLDKWLEIEKKYKASARTMQLIFCKTVSILVIIFNIKNQIL